MYDVKNPGELIISLFGPQMRAHILDAAASNPDPKDAPLSFLND